MKVLIYCNKFDNRSNRLVALCQALSERDYEIHVLSPNGRSTATATVHPGTLTDAVPLCGQLLPELTIDWELNYPADLHFLAQPTLNHKITTELNQLSFFSRLLQKLKHFGTDAQRRIAREYTLLNNPSAVFFTLNQEIADSAIADGTDPEWVNVCPVEDPLADDFDSYVEWMDELLELVRARKAEMEELEIPV